MKRLERSRLCANLSAPELRRVTDAVALRTYSAGEVICRQGEPGHRRYSIASGRLSLTVLDPDLGEERFIDYREPGDHFGEMALFAGGKRTATLTALVDCELFELGYADFESILEKVPRFTANIAGTLVRRLEKQTGGRPTRSLPRSLGLVNTSDRRCRLIEPLASALIGAGESLCVVSDGGPVRELAGRGVVHALESGAAAGSKVAAILADQLSHPQPRHRVLADVSLRNMEQEVDRVLALCEEIWLLVDSEKVSDAAAAIGPLLARRPRLTERVRLVWILGEDERYAPMRPVDLKLPATDFKVVLSADPACPSVLQQKSISRLVHHLQGTRIGVALSGGGANSLAQFGALRAFEREGVYVDLMAGTSCGAFVSCFYSIFSDPDESLRAMSRGLSPNWFLRTLPRGNDWFVLAMFRGHGWARFLKDSIGTPGFEQLQIPVSTVGVDLVSGRELVRDSGDVVKSVVESINLPVLSAPILAGDAAIVDGGVLDNLPVSVLPKRGADIVIAMDVSPKLPEGFCSPAGARAPGVLKSLTRILLVQQRAFATRHRAAADVFIEMDTAAFGFSGFTEARELAAIGEAAAMESLPTIKRLIGEQRARNLCSLGGASS